MSNQKGNKLLDFLSGKGFYVVLILCVAAICVSGYMLFFGGPGGDDRDSPSLAEALPPQMSVSPANPSVPPAASPVLPPPSPPRAAMTTPVPPSVPPVAAEPPEVPAEPVDDSDGESVDVAGEVNNLPELDDLPADVSAASEVPAAQEPTFFLPVSAGTILTPYSESADVFYEYLREWRYHPGIDLETNAGALVQSAADGVVKEVIESADRNMGVTVVVKHGADFETVYSNLMDMVKVTAGQTVAAGETIAAVGDTAVSELALPAHLHFEILRDGVPVDPADYLPEIP